jgi:hypothetical protein
MRLRLGELRVALGITLWLVDFLDIDFLVCKLLLFLTSVVLLKDLRSILEIVGILTYSVE